MPWIGRIPESPACNRSEWKTKRPMATSTTAMGKISQNSVNDNSVTEFVIGTGPVRAIVKLRELVPSTPCQVHISEFAAVPSALYSQGRGVLAILSRVSFVFLMISFVVFSSLTAIAIMARSSVPSGPPSGPSISRANLSRPGVGLPSSSYISPMIKSMVVCEGIS